MKDTDALPTLNDRVSQLTDVTYGDLALIGAALLSTVSLHGWASPGSSLDYTKGDAGPHAAIVRDFVAWTAHRKRLADGCEERLLSYVEASGWTDHLQDRLGKTLMPGSPSDR